MAVPVQSENQGWMRQKVRGALTQKVNVIEEKNQSGNLGHES